MAERVELTDLNVISRYSLAVRSATADRDELIAALQSDLEWLGGAPKPVRKVAAKVAPAKTTAKTMSTRSRSAR